MNKKAITHKIKQKAFDLGFSFVGISKAEFLEVYLKNNDDPKYDKESLDEYMELYRKFKLIVTEADEIKLDTTKALYNELKGYEYQLAKQYLTDPKIFPGIKNPKSTAAAEALSSSILSSMYFILPPHMPSGGVMLRERHLS